MFQLGSSLKNNYLITIFLVSVLYSLFVGSGLYGFGSDYYTTYSKFSNYSPKPLYKDWFGYKISTLNLYDFYIGIYLISFIICFSTGKLIYNFFKINKNSSLVFFIILFLIIIHTWPILKSSNTALRQGLAMSFLYLSICALNKNKIMKSIFFITTTLFSHTSGPFFFVIYILALFLKSSFKIPLLKKNKFLSLIIINIMTILFYFYLNYSRDTSIPGKIYGADFSSVFFYINIVLILVSTRYLNFLFHNNFFLYSYIFLFFSMPIYLCDLYTQYERLNMMMVIMNIFVFSLVFKKNHNKFLWFVSFIFLLVVTYLTGMFIPYSNLIST